MECRSDMVKAPFIFDRAQEDEGILRPNTLLGFILGWQGWKYYIAYPWQRCKCGVLVHGDDCCHKCSTCNCECGS